jgi:ligand-binding sensor domain-containing protein/two-component sensor histidine kinase
MTVRVQQISIGGERTARVICVLTILLFLPAFARAERLPTRIFTTADGLANNVVLKIVSDSRGFLWFCTREGLSRFDGVAFVTYGVEDGLPSATVRDLIESRDGRYWIATSRGVVLFDPLGTPLPQQDGRRPPMFRLYPPPDPAVAIDVLTLLEDHAGTLWIGTIAGLYRRRDTVNGGALEFVDLGFRAEVVSLAEQPANELWIGTSGGLVRREGGVVDRPATHEALSGAFVKSLLNDREGRIWAGTTRAGLVLIEREPQTGAPVVKAVFGLPEGLPTPWVSQVIQATDGSVWAVTTGGLARLVTDPDGHPRRFRGYAASLGLTSGVSSASEDRNGRLWIGTVTGAARVLAGGFTVFTAEDGVPAASSLLETPKREIVALTAGATDAGAITFDGHSFLPIRLPHARGENSWGWNQMMLVDHLGDWWIGTRRGVIRVEGVDEAKGLETARRKRVYSRRDGLASDVVIRLFEDSRGDIWVATVEGSNGLSRWQRSVDRWHHYTTADGFPFDAAFIASMAEDRGGHVWFGFSGDGGLARYRDGGLTRYGADSGVPPGTIRNLFIDSRGRLWAGSFRSGLVRVDEPESERPRFDVYTTEHGLSSNEISAVSEDRFGQIYAGTGRGIDRLDPLTGRVVTFWAGTGLPACEVFSALRDRTGVLWFGCISGLMRLVPAAPRQAARPSILISAITLDGKPAHVSAVGQLQVGPFEIPPGGGAIDVQYVSPGFGPDDSVRYQFMLVGADRAWSDPTPRRSISYANLGAGSYRFLVRAVHADGTLSADAAGFAFTVLAPVWRRGWFLSLVFLGIGATGYGLYRHRLARVTEISDMRARIAKDLHDDVGANLTRIAVLSEVARRRPADDAQIREGLGSIATVARESMTAMSDIVWAISPEREALSDFARRMREHAEETFAASDVRVSVAVGQSASDLRLRPDVRRDVYLVFKEATNNAARHGSCSAIDVALRCEGCHLILTVADDGRGFDEHTVAQGNGLQNMRQRAIQVNGSFSLTSRPGEGTTVTLSVPLPGGRGPLPQWVGHIFGRRG